MNPSILQNFSTRRLVASMLLVSLLSWSTIIYFTTGVAEAAQATNFSDTLSDSAPTSVSDHTLQFTLPNGLGAGETIALTFPAQFNMNGVDFADMDLADDTTDVTLAAAPAGATWGAVLAGQVITFTNGSTVVASSSVVEIQVGLNATAGATGDTQIINPTATSSYEITVATNAGGGDNGATRVAIIENVTVTAQVGTSFVFTVTGVDATVATTVNGETVTASSTSTTLPFGLLTAGVPSVVAHDLSVTTNAAQGFVVTVYQDNNLLSGSGADIDGFIDGVYTNTPTAWVAPTGNAANEDTWGHWGLTSEDSDLNSDEFGTQLFVAASTTPRTIFSHASSSDGGTADTGKTRVGYKTEITALQEAGLDYETTLTYIATPTF